MIEHCLRSVMALDRHDIQILIIDQSPDDETRPSAQAVANGDSRITIIHSDSVGVSEARNLAVELTNADVIAFADDDCVVEPGWLDALLSEFADPRVVGVYGRIVPPGFTTRNGTEIVFKESRSREVFEARVPPWYVGHGASRALRRTALVGIGGFDVHLGPGATLCAAEDLDSAYRLLVAGGRLVYTGSAVSYHKDWRDWTARRKRERAYGVGVGAVFTKHLRCGDAYAVILFAIWIWQLGVRRIGAGLLKWRSFKPMYLGYCELLYPWIGAVSSLRFPIDLKTRVYTANPQHLAERGFHQSEPGHAAPSYCRTERG